MSRYDINIRSCTSRQMSRHDMPFTSMHAFHKEFAHFQAVNLCYDNFIDAMGRQLRPLFKAVGLDLVVRNAGHMTPAFAPRASYDMLTRFLNAKAFDKSAEGNNALKIPQCAQCGGAGPFAGKALPACASQQ